MLETIKDGALKLNKAKGHFGTTVAQGQCGRLWIGGELFNPSPVQPTYCSILGQDTKPQIAIDVASSGENVCEWSKQMERAGLPLPPVCECDL